MVLQAPITFLTQLAPLDMRMNQDENIPTAADIVNTYSAKQLADILWMVRAKNGIYNR